MGPASVDGWLSGLLAAELGVRVEGLLDHTVRGLRVEGRVIKLTRREFEVMRYLEARAEATVARDDLIHDVWGLRYDPGSNVVDAVIASLRRKLGPLAGAVETVPQGTATSTTTRSSARADKGISHRILTIGSCRPRAGP